MSEVITFLQETVAKYPEMAWLTGDVQATPEASVEAEDGKTFGEVLFSGADKASLTELNRTAVGLATLYWVLKDDYESFTACQKASKLTPESFKTLRDWTVGILPDDEAFDAMVVYTVINDLGKIQSVIEKARAMGIENVDHDKVLVAVLEQKPEISPSFQGLSSHYQNLILTGLRAEFNLGQFVQGENVPASLQKLVGIDQLGLNFYFLHTLFDIAGAAGQFVQNGSVVMTEATYRGIYLAVDCLLGLNEGENVQQVYNKFLTKKARSFDVDVQHGNHEYNLMVTRLCCMLRVSDITAARQVEKVVQRLNLDHQTRNVVAILKKEMNIAGSSDGWATLIYYAPAILANITKGKEGSEFEKALRIGLITLANIYQDAHISTRKRAGSGVFTVMASQVASSATKGVDKFQQKSVNLVMNGEDADVKMVDAVTIDQSSFTSNMLSVKNPIPGKKVALIGMGGGSDCVQAAILGLLLKNAGQEVPCIISVRTKKTASQSPDGKVGEQRAVESHGGEITKGVFKIIPETTGTGRFLENVPAEDVPVYLVIEEAGQLTQQIDQVIEHVGGVDTVVGIDTGGDALYPVSIGAVDQVKATPDQDLRVLQAINDLDAEKVSHRLSCEIAVGIDSPADAGNTLLVAHAVRLTLTSEEKAFVSAVYKRYQMDGMNDKRFGKTPLSWQLALNGKTGLNVIPLPERVILSDTNPWRTFMNILPATQDMFVMKTQDHLDAIESTA